MRPWEGLANQDRVIGPGSWVAGLQLAPPLVEEMNPTFSWQGAALQPRLGEKWWGHPMGAVAPGVERSPPMPGMKWSTVLEVASIGTRVTGPQVVSLVDLLMTMSLAAQPERNRQSCQTT